MAIIGDWYWAMRELPEVTWQPQPANDSNVQAMIIADRRFTGEMEQMFEQDFAHAEPVDPEALDDKPFWWHLGFNLSRLAAPVL